MPSTQQNKVPKLYVFEDNQSTICVLEKGSSHKLAHATRTHRVNLHCLTEVLTSEDVILTYVASADQAADIFTKAFLVPQTWKGLCKLINIFEPNEIPVRSVPLVTCLPNLACITLPAMEPDGSKSCAAKAADDGPDACDGKPAPPSASSSTKGWPPYIENHFSHRVGNPVPATYAEWKAQLGSDLSYSAGIPVPTEEEEINEKSRKDSARRSTEASAPERSIESVWAFFAYSISRAIAVMHGTCEVRGMITDVPGCYKACSRIASSLLELSGHLPETRKSLRRLAEMPHPPLHHPRDLAKVHFIHLDIISDSSLCIRPAQKSKNWKTSKGLTSSKLAWRNSCRTQIQYGRLIYTLSPARRPRTFRELLKRRRNASPKGKPRIPPSKSITSRWYPGAVMKRHRWVS